MKIHWCFLCMEELLENEFDELISQFDTAEVFPVVTRFPADLITPFGAYLKISQGAEYSFLFESVEGGENLARYSFLGANPERLVFEHHEKTIITSDTGETVSDKPIFEYLKDKLRLKSIADVQNLPSFIGGAVGFFDFAVIEHFEPILKNTKKRFAESSQSQFGFYKTTVAFDHARQQIAIITLVFKDNNDENALRARLEKAKLTNTELYSKLETPGFPQIAKSGIDSNYEITSNWERKDFEESVLKIKELILAGECYQVVLSQCLARQTSATPEAIYRALRALNPSPYMILLKLGGKSIIGASPEMLVRCRDRRLEYRPIAGTRPRSENLIEDSKLADEMRADAKEVSEHTMLVDLGRNDLG